MYNKEIKTKENIFKLIKKGVNELYLKKWKFIFVIIYEIIAFFLWNISCALWEMLPFNQLPELIHKLIEISYFGIIATILILLLLQVIIYISKLSHKKQKNRCEIGFKRCGLETNTGEQPILIDTFPDKETAHGIVYKFDNLQIPISKWENKTEDIEKILKGKIVRFEEENTTDTTNVVITPYQYVTPYIINANDEALSSMENCLIVGQTGSRKKLYSLNNTWENSYL